MVSWVGDCLVVEVIPENVPAEDGMFVLFADVSDDAVASQRYRATKSAPSVGYQPDILYSYVRMLLHRRIRTCKQLR